MASSKRLRAEGKVPGVVYGLDSGPAERVGRSGPSLRTRRSNTEAGLNALITLEVGDHTELTIVKDLQRDPVRRSVEHVDFLRVDRNVTITVEVPITLIGEAKEVEQEQGIVEQLLHTLTVNARPGSIPPHLEVDISGLAIGGAVRVSDLTLPAEGATTRGRPRRADRHRQRHPAPPRPRRRGRPRVPRRGDGEGADGSSRPTAADADGGGSGDASSE